MLSEASPLFQWLNAHPELAGLVTFIISASESVAIIGTIVPGSITMAVIGALAGAGIIPLWSTLLCAIFGAILGDGISYWLGHHFKDRIKSFWPFRHYPGLLESGEVFVHRYGVMSVFVGRFVGPVRALVPLVAGMLGMRPLPFIIANVASAIGWAPAYMLPGILLGAAALELPPDIAMNVMMVFVIVSLLFILGLWLLYKFLKLFHNQIEQLQNWIWSKFKNSRLLSPITRLLKHRDPVKMHGQLNLAFYFLLTMFLFFCLAFYVTAVGPSSVPINNAIYHLFRGIHTHGVDVIMLNITLLGQKEILLPVILVIFVLLLIYRRFRTAFHALALGVMCAGSVYVLKHLLKSPRPWGIFQNPETWSMPSGHTALATTVFMGLAFLIARSVQPKFRKLIYFIGILLSFMVGVSRLYLGAHWFTDVLGSWLLASALLMLVILSYERQTEPREHAASILLVTFFCLLITFTTYHYYYFNRLLINYSQLNYPTHKIAMNNWWQKNDMLAAYNTSLFGFPSYPINIAWTGNIRHIQESLQKEGWIEPPARDVISTLHRIADVQSTEYLSMISPQYLDKRPELILVRRGVPGVKGLVVIRLWESNRVIAQTSSPIWVGMVSIAPRTYSWIFKKHPGELVIDPAFIFPNKMGEGSWEWKIVQDKDQKILLIRENKKIHRKK